MKLTLSTPKDPLYLNCVALISIEVLLRSIQLWVLLGRQRLA